MYGGGATSGKGRGGQDYNRVSLDEYDFWFLSVIIVAL